jgi:hypothetical protein
MVNRVRKTNFVPLGNGHSVGAVVNSDNQFVLDFGGTDRRAVVTTNNPNVSGAADFTATASQSGSTFRATKLAGLVVTLPAAADVAEGTRFTLMNEALVTSGTGHQFTPASGDGIGGAGLAYTDDGVLRLTPATDVLGDYVTIESDGVADWHIVALKGIFAKA